MTAARIDAIVPVHAERPENIARTVRGLLAQELAPSRIAVVDDCSPDPIALADEPTGAVELLRLDENVGVAAARNAAAATSRAEFLLFVNCEVVLGPRWLAAAVAFMEARPDVGAVGGPVVPRMGPEVLRRWRMRFLENPEQRAQEEREVAWLTGHAILLRRATFDEVGGYDRRYRSSEDHELCERLRARGHRIYHLPDLVADSFEIPSVELFARKSLRHSGWALRKVPPDTRDLEPARRGPAATSALRAFASHSGRNLYRHRWSLVRVDAAVAMRSLALVWAATRRDGAAST